MNTYKKYFSTVLAFVFVFSLALSANAQTWVGPSGTPPNFNTPAPVNVGPLGQVKSGWLHLGNQIPGGFKFGVDGASVFNGPVSVNSTGNSGNFFKVNDGTTNTTSLGSVLTNDGTGVAKWMPSSGGGSLPNGAANNTLYWNATTGAWTPNTELLSDGTNVRIGSGISLGGLFSNLKLGVNGTSLFNGDTTAFINDAGTTHVRIGLPLMPSTTPYDTAVLGVTGLSVFDGNIIGGQDINVVGGSHFSQNAGAQTTVGSQQNFPSNIKFGVTGGQVRIDDGSAIPGYVLTSSDTQGTAYWAPVSSTPTPGSGTTIANGNTNDTLRWNGSVWEPSSNLSNDTNRVVVGAGMPGMPGSSKFQVNKEGDSTANDWYAHPFSIQGTDQTLFMGVDSNSLRRSSYIQAAGGTNPRTANGLLLNPQGGNVRIGSGAAQSFPTGGIPLAGSFVAPGTNNQYISEFSNIKLGVTGSAMFRGPLWVIDGSQGDGKVLTSNADGKATWQPAFTLPNGTTNGQTLVWDSNTETWIPGSVIGDGTADDTLRWNGTQWVTSDFMNNNDSLVSILRGYVTQTCQGSFGGGVTCSPAGELFKAKATGFIIGNSEQGLTVYDNGATSTNGLLVDGSASIQGNTTVGSSTSNKLTKLFGKLRVEVNSGIIAEFIGTGDFKIKSGANVGEVTIGAGTQNGIPLRVDGNVYAQVPGNPNITTQFQYVPAQAVSCGSEQSISVNLPVNYPQNAPDAFSTAAHYVETNNLLSIESFNCPTAIDQDIQFSSKLIRSSNTAGTCAVTNPISAANLITRNCANSYSATGPSRVYELYAGTSDGEMTLTVTSGGNITSIRYAPYVLPFDKVDSNIQNPQGNFIGNGARLFGLSAQSGEQPVCSDISGWLRPCVNPNQSFTAPDIKIVKHNFQGAIKNEVYKLYCPTDYKAIAAGCDTEHGQLEICQIGGGEVESATNNGSHDFYSQDSAAVPLTTPNTYMYGAAEYSDTGVNGDLHITVTCQRYQ